MRYANVDFFQIQFEEFGGRLDAEALTQFVDAGGNVLVAGSTVIGRALFD